MQSTKRPVATTSLRILPLNPGLTPKAADVLLSRDRWFASKNGNRRIIMAVTGAVANEGSVRPSKNVRDFNDGVMYYDGPILQRNESNTPIGRAPSPLRNEGPSATPVCRVANHNHKHLHLRKMKKVPHDQIIFQAFAYVAEIIWYADGR